MQNCKELEVWQKAVRLALHLYKGTEQFPQAEKFGLAGQIRRGATSVPPNIAEGWGRGSTKEYVQFLLIARGSLSDLETHALIARELSYLNPQRLEHVQKQVGDIGKMLNRLVQSLRGR